MGETQVCQFGAQIHQLCAFGRQCCQLDNKLPGELVDAGATLAAGRHKALYYLRLIVGTRAIGLSELLDHFVEHGETSL
jgi:hypothetical protein